MIEQISLILLFVFFIKLISWLFDNSKLPKPKPEETSPEETNNTETRTFNWFVNDNIKSHSLHCEVNINRNVVEEAKAELLNDSPPSKVIFTGDEDYFNLSNYEILHDRFGIGCREIEQITNYLRGYADDHYCSNYQFAILILSFVHEQNIKYSYDEDSTGYMEYLRFPIETIFDKTGDCDCKAILASTLFKNLGFRVAFALMPGHAALAISTDSAPFFANFEMNGTSWFYCESTGDNWKPGQLPGSITIKNISIREV